MAFVVQSLSVFNLKAIVALLQSYFSQQIESSALSANKLSVNIWVRRTKIARPRSINFKVSKV